MAKRSTEEPDYTVAETEMKYYDMLYSFAGVVSKANEQSFNGWEPKMIAKTLRKSSEAFFNLCMMDQFGHLVSYERCKANAAEEKKGPAQRAEGAAEAQGTPVGSRSRGKAAQSEEEPETLPERPRPGNFLRIENGWGLCPVCSSKVLRVTMATRLENFPVYCKRCRAEHLVNWWNAEQLRIEYKRYINDSHLRNQALKGTGLQSYRNSGSSATERVAMMFR